MEIVGLTNSRLDAVELPPEEPELLLDELELLLEELPPELELLLDELEPLLEELPPELELLLEEPPDELEPLVEELTVLEGLPAEFDSEEGVALAVELPPEPPPHAERARAKIAAAITRRGADGQSARIIAVSLRSRFQYSVAT